MLHPLRILPRHLPRRLPGNLPGRGEEVLLAVVQALGRGGGTALDRPAACHVGLSMGDGGGFGLGDGAALGRLLGELFLGREFRLHWEGVGRMPVLWLEGELELEVLESVVTVLWTLLSLRWRGSGGGWGSKSVGGLFWVQM